MGSSSMTCSSRRISGTSLSFNLRLRVWGPWTNIFCLDTVCRMISDTARSEWINVKWGVGKWWEGAVQKLLFDVEANPLHYMQAPISYTSDPRLRHIRHTSVYEIGVHFVELFFDTLKNCNVQTTRQRCVYHWATCHGPTRWADFLGCSGLRFCMHWMLQRVESVWFFDRKR